MLGIGMKSIEANPTEDAIWAWERLEMVKVLKDYGIRDQRVLAAMARVRRHLFIPEGYRTHGEAYGDYPCPIGYGQTISQPFIVAYMTEKIAPGPGETILEIGVGSGYQAAILAELGARVYSVEIIPQLAEHARRVLSEERYGDRVMVLAGDGNKGWPEYAPYDAMIGTCAPVDVPRALVDQLKENGRLILPVGNWMSQRLVILRKVDGCIHQADDLPVRFVPMTRHENDLAGL
jgi:protein-L-isoaspartate(D-aspartate) O-methyltransferase